MPSIVPKGNSATHSKARFIVNVMVSNALAVSVRAHGHQPTTILVRAIYSVIVARGTTM
jgi:hypothetical protein